MGAFEVELLTELIETLLLGLHRGSGWPRRFVLERFVHALVLAVLLWPARFDEFWQDSQPHPPGREHRQPPETDRREGNPVITADPLRQTVFLKQPPKHGLGILT